MTQRVFLARSVIGWTADRSLPRLGRLVREPHSGRVFAVDVSRQSVTPLAGGPVRQIRSAPGSYCYDGVWHPDSGLLIASGLPHGRGSWALLRVGDDGSTHDIGVPAGTAVMSLSSSADEDLLLGVASTEVAGGRQVGGGIATFIPRTKTFSWLYRPPAGEHFVPSGVCWDFGAVVWVHTSRHALMRLTPQGRLECIAGNFGHPDSDLHSLNSPTAVTAHEGGYLLTDSGNRRVLLADRDGMVLRSLGSATEGVHLVDPRHALSADGRVYIADLGARSVLELGPDLETVRERWGGPGPGDDGLVLSRPRSIDRAPAGELVIADTNNDRIVGVDDHGRLRWQILEVTGADGRSEALRWPRSARMSAAGRLVVSDSLNSRILIIDRDGLVEAEFGRVLLGGESFAVSDPHDGRWIGEDELLLVDSTSAWVARVGRDGVAVWVLAALTDPHQAVVFRDRVVVVDPGMGSVLMLDAATGAEMWRRDEFFDTAGNGFRLNKPRVVEATAEGVLVVDADSQVLALGPDWSVIWCWNPKQARALGHGADFDVPEAPRDLMTDSTGQILLSDYRRNCVLKLEAVA